MHPDILQIIKNTNEILEPETLRITHPDYSEVEINRILALATLYKTEAFFENFFLFEDIVQALNGRIPDPTNIEGALPEEIWYALDTAHRLFPTHEYAIEVLKYIQFWFNEAGVYVYPPYLPIPNPYYSVAVYKSTNGPFPLDESEQGIQAAKYLVIQTYIENKKGLI